MIDEKWSYKTLTVSVALIKNVRNSVKISSEHGCYRSHAFLRCQERQQELLHQVSINLHFHTYQYTVMLY